MQLIRRIEDGLIEDRRLDTVNEQSARGNTVLFASVYHTN